MAKSEISVAALSFKLTLKCLDELSNESRGKYVVVKVAHIVKCAEDKYGKRISTRQVFWYLMMLTGLLKGRILLDRSHAWVFLIPRTNLRAFLRKHGVVGGDGHVQGQG